MDSSSEDSSISSGSSSSSYETCGEDTPHESSSDDFDEGALFNIIEDILYFMLA